MKQYIVTRSDLPPGAQAVQSCHVMKRFTVEHPEFADVENLALLTVPDEPALADVLAKVTDAGAKASYFREPDFDDELTAVAFDETARRLVSNLPCALRDRKAA